MDRTVSTRTLQILAAVALALCVVFAFGAMPAHAKDVSGSVKKAKSVKLSKFVKSSFHKSGDEDAFKFKAKKTGTYRLAVYGQMDGEIQFGKLKNGKMGSAKTEYCNGSNFVFKLGKLKKGKKMCVLFHGSSKHKYKFKIYKSSTKKYSLKYVLNGGENNENNVSKYSDKKFVELYDPDWPDFSKRFEGWYLKSGKKALMTIEGYPVIDPATHKNLTLYARWSD